MVNSQELNKTISELETQVKKFKSISEVYSELIVLKSDLIKLKEQSRSSSEKLKTTTEKLDAKLEGYEKLLSDLAKGNKNFQKELEQYITSKLDKHKSDIQVEIRNEGTQIQRGFENSLTLNFNNLQTKIQEINSKQEKQISLLKILLFIIITLCLGLGAAILLK
jgi:DNA repair exonuclease SbcCD ATPase subunit